MKKLISIFTAVLFAFVLTTSFSSCATTEEEKVEETVVGWPLMDHCVSQFEIRFNKNVIAPEFEEMNIPSNEDLSICFCEKLVENNPSLTEEELNEIASFDMSEMEEDEEIDFEEVQRHMEWTIKCMGFDSMEDYFEKMMEISGDLEVE